MSNQLNYWEECISNAAEECGVVFTKEQLSCIATGAMDGHEYYGMAFYSPPSSDRINEIEREYKEKLAALKKDYEKYQDNSEKAIKNALHLHADDHISIGNYGEVTRYGGRIERIL